MDYLLDDEQTDPAPTSAGPRKSGFARFWRTYGFVSGYLISLVGILGLVRIAATLAAGFRLGGIADFGSVDPQWLEGLSTSPIFTDLSSRYRQALILSQIPDFLLCAALGVFLVCNARRKLVVEGSTLSYLPTFGAARTFSFSDVAGMKISANGRRLLGRDGKVLARFEDNQEGSTVLLQILRSRGIGLTL